jgi:hypothetical protein
MRNERNRRIWRGLVAYANTGNLDPSIILDSLPWGCVIDGFDSLKDLTSARFKEQAAKYHSSVSALLRCSCDPKSRQIHSVGVQKFLWEHNEHFSFALAMPTFKDANYSRKIMGKLRELSFLAILAGTRSYPDIADTIIGFVLAELEKFVKREYKEPTPIIVCGNPACNKLAMPERIGTKKFCSDDCKAADQRTKIPQKERTDYQWLYRLLKMSPAPMRKALKDEENRKRFTRIKAEMDYGPACQKLIRKLEQYT